MEQTSHTRKEQYIRRLSVPGRDIVVPTRSVQRLIVSPKAVAGSTRPMAPLTGPVIDSLVYRRASSRAGASTELLGQPVVKRVGYSSQKIVQGLARSAGYGHRLMDTTSRDHAVKKSHHKEKRRSSHLRQVMVSRPVRIGLAVIVVAAVGYIGLDVWHTNTELKQDLTKTVSALGSPSATAHQDNEGRDETPVASSSIDSYKVAASLPRVVTIQNAKIHARVVPMDVNSDNSIQAPINIYDAGWYTGSAKPGEPGAALIDGHASGATRQGLFAYLDTLKIGDTVEIERGDGQKFVYQVIHTDIVPKDEVDMTQLLKPYGDIPQGLNLITCTGRYIKDQKTYDHRAIVYTKLLRLGSI